MRPLALALLMALLAVGGFASASTRVKGLGAQPAADSVARADVDGIWKFYRAAPIQRTLARWIAVLSGALLVVATIALMRGSRRRNEKGLRQRPTYLVVLVAPLMLLILGLWIGWGQTRIDLERDRVEIRPLGIPFPARAHQLGEADRLVVVPVPGVSSGYLSGRSVTSPGTFWHVRLEGPELGVALKVQLGSEAEALELAERISDVVALPVEVSPAR